MASAPRDVRRLATAVHGRQLACSAFMAHPDDTRRIDSKRSVPTVHYSARQLEKVFEQIDATVPNQGASGPHLDAEAVLL
jgi:hypothetical protein